MAEQEGSQPMKTESPDLQPIVNLDEGPRIPDDRRCANRSKPVLVEQPELPILTKLQRHPVQEENIIEEEAVIEPRYAQLKLPNLGLRRLRPDKIIEDLLRTAQDGRPSQKAEARYHLRQILKQNESHFMREEISAALGMREDDSVRIHTIQQDTEKIETQRNFSSQVIMMLKEFAELLNDGNLAIRTVISGFLQKMPEGFGNLKSMMKKNGPGFVKNIISFVGGKTVNKMILAGKLLGGAIIYPVKMGLFLCGTLALATLVVITDKIFNGQISQTGRYASKIPAYA